MAVIKDSRWEQFNYDELLVILKGLSKDVLRWTDVSQELYRQVENEMNKRNKNSLARGEGLIGGTSQHTF